jgi:two-component system response regulator YesN
MQKDDSGKICQLLKTVTKLDVRLINEEGNTIFKMVDHFPPPVLQNIENQDQNIIDTLRGNQSNSYYHYLNSYGLEYIASGIRDNDSFYGCIILGPFVSNTSVIDLLSGIISQNQLPVSQRKQLEGFYKSLPMITSNEYKSIGTLLVNMCGNKYTDSHLINKQVIIPPINKVQLQEKLDESKQIIERRYEEEKKLMDAIAKGNKEAAAQLSSGSMDILDFSNRIPESPIRSAKNISLVLNTICRISAEKGGLHPIYIDNISEKFAILIERAPNLNQLKSIITVMINEYCDLVKTYSTKNYSPIVKKAVNYINFNLENQLTLHTIASTLHVNPSVLSRKFKEDTTMNIIEFINHNRVEEAKFYLQQGNTSITEVAFMVGFNDLNYFTRVFKKITSFTPSQYIKEAHRL